MIYLYTCFSSLPYVFFPPEKRWISKMQAIHENYFQKEEDLVKKKQIMSFPMKKMIFIRKQESTKARCYSV